MRTSRGPTQRHLRAPRSLAAKLPHWSPNHVSPWSGNVSKHLLTHSRRACQAKFTRRRSRWRARYWRRTWPPNARQVSRGSSRLLVAPDRHFVCMRSSSWQAHQRLGGVGARARSSLSRFLRNRRAHIGANASRLTVNTSRRWCSASAFHGQRSCDRGPRARARPAWAWPATGSAPLAQPRAKSRAVYFALVCLLVCLFVWPLPCSVCLT